MEITINHFLCFRLVGFVQPLAAPRTGFGSGCHLATAIMIRGILNGRVPRAATFSYVIYHIQTRLWRLRGPKILTSFQPI